MFVLIKKKKKKKKKITKKFLMALKYLSLIQYLITQLLIFLRQSSIIAHLNLIEAIIFLRVNT
jgi:ACR3 family arsenite efflux pump ArsB